MFHFSFHYQHQIQRVPIVGALAMLVALLVTWTTQTTRSHADDYNTAADEATRDFRQMESQRQAVADLQAQTRNQAQMRDLQAQPAFDPGSYTGPNG